MRDILFRGKTEKGEWVYGDLLHPDNYGNGYSCSECSAFVDEEMFDTGEFHKVFCGNCGARMDGRSESDG